MPNYSSVGMQSIRLKCKNSFQRDTGCPKTIPGLDLESSTMTVTSTITGDRETLSLSFGSGWLSYVCMYVCM